MTFVRIAEIGQPEVSHDKVSVMIGVRTDQGKDTTIECPVEIVAELIGKMASAVNLAVEAGAPTSTKRFVGIVKTEVGIPTLTGYVSLTMYPSEHLGIPFVLTSKDARILSSHLARAAATVEATPSGKPS